MLLIRSLLFNLGMWGSVIIFAPLSVLTFPFPFKWRYGFITQWSRLNIWWLKVTCRLCFDVAGIENIPKSNAIIMCKHQSAWETLALQRIFPPQVWVLKRELLWLPFFGWGLAMLEPIAIDRQSGRKAVTQLLRQGTARLKNGRWVVIFPEGTRVEPGKRGRYRVGGAILAEHSGYPIVPVAHNAGEYWPRKSFVISPGTIKMVIGPLIDGTGLTAEQIINQVETWIESEMEKISHSEV